ncbi:hypothetical protein V6N11_082970 [Hibiscus sabdariffa]|uniref:Uncharacterized protein n=1 Tax=Hibiscus sabdariffa TaxID=183260 RepID=A0ABR2QKY5_9ROSI
MTEENLVDDDIENKFTPIAIQLDFVHQLLGQTPKANRAYTDIIRMTAEPSLSVAVNNLIVVKCPKHISDSSRKLEHAIVLKLSPKQKTIYAIRVLLLHANKMDQARELVSILLETFPDSVMQILFQAAVLVRENKSGETEEILVQFAEIQTENVAMLHATEASMQEFKASLLS